MIILNFLNSDLEELQITYCVRRGLLSRDEAIQKVKQIEGKFHLHI